MLDTLGLPKLDENEQSAGSGAVKPWRSPTKTNREGAGGGDRSLNPYLATPYDLYGPGAASGDRSAADLYGAGAALDPLRSLGGTQDHGASFGPGLAAAPGQAPGAQPESAPDGLSALPDLRAVRANPYPDPAATDLRDATVDHDNRDFDRASLERGDPLSPQTHVYGASPATPRPEALKGDPSGLLGFNPYDAKSIVGPIQSAAQSASELSLGAAGLSSALAPPGSLTGVGANGNTALQGSLSSPLPSTLASPLGPKSPGTPLR